MTTGLPALSEALPRASGWAMAACFGLSLLFLVGFVAPSPHADDWGSLATISSTMGVQEGRLCLGESTRGDLGCPAYAPYVSRTTGYVGIGTNGPITPLHIKGPLTIEDNTGSVRTLSISASPDGLLHTIKSSNSMAGYQFSNMAGPLMTIENYGHVGISTTNPSATLHVFGTLRIAAGNETCDTNRRGAMKYENNDFHLCRNGTTWESLSSVASGNGTPDQITSGTAFVKTHDNGLVTISGTTTYLNSYGTHDARFVIGAAAGGNRYSYIDLVGDTTYTNFGLRLIRNKTGPNTTSAIQHRGTGGLFLQTDDEAPIIFNVSKTEAMRIAANGNTGIGTTTPTTKLEVAGTVSATTLQLADNPSNPCNAANKGMAKVVGGRIYVCRYP